jgi:hypothetical protein
VRGLSCAAPLFERALAIYEKALGIEHPDTAWSANNLAVLLRDMGCPREAKQLMARRNQTIKKCPGCLARRMLGGVSAGDVVNCVAVITPPRRGRCPSNTLIGKAYPCPCFVYARRPGDVLYP